MKNRKMKPYMACVFDCETTGLVDNRTLPLDKQPEVIEFYSCLVDLSTGKIKSELDLLIRPSRMPLPEKIAQITGITDEMLSDSPAFASVAETIFAIIEKAPLVIAHNCAFDKDMLEIEAERLGRTIKWPRTLCTVEQTVGMKGYRLSLSALHEELFKEPFAGSHRARADVQALLRCCVELRKRGMI